MAAKKNRKRGLLERLKDDAVICSEGYLFELERRGYLQAGTFVPEVVLEDPDVLAQVHREFVRAGSDVVEAFTYYGHREKMRLIGKEDLLEPLNRNAVKIAKSVARKCAKELGIEEPLVAGNICNTNVYDPADKKSATVVRKMFEEAVAWAAEERVDYIIAETIYFLEEARIALDAIKKTGLPSVVTLGLMGENGMRDGKTAEDACRILKDDGADVVGLNCFRGPATLMPYLEKIRKNVSGPVAALPVPYRTTAKFPTFFNMADRNTSCDLPENRTFPTALDPFLCNRYEMGAWARKAYDMNVRYLGICCGNSPVLTRAVAESIGRKPYASKYSPMMEKHFLFGRDASLKKVNTRSKALW